MYIDEGTNKPFKNQIKIKRKKERKKELTITTWAMLGCPASVS